MSTKVVEIKTLKVGKYIVLGGEASKITSLTTSSPGKHGAAKAGLEAVGIFDNQKRSIVKPVDTKVDIPIIDKRVGQVLSIQGNNVQLMDMENYDTLDLPMPEELKDQITNISEIDDYKYKASLKSDFERSELNKDKTLVEVKKGTRL